MKDRSRPGFCSPPAPPVAVLSLLILSLSAIPAGSQMPGGRAPHTTVVVFADHPLQPDQWTLLFADLRSGLAGGGTETEALDQSADFVRGDEVTPGFLVDSAITVYLHGNCTLHAAVQRTAYGVPLGWVRRVDGRIEPFAHVDCTRIGQVLGPQALWMDQERRERTMSRAIARVILHEWIHIANQSPSHAQHGIAKAEFGVSDLMGGR